VEATEWSGNMFYYQGRPVSVLPKGEYDVFLVISVRGMGDSNIYTDGLYFTQGSGNQKITLTFTPDVSPTEITNFTEIGRNGIRVLTDLSNYFYTDGKNFVIRNDMYAFGQNKNDGF
jgi:hypothetical protein